MITSKYHKRSKSKKRIELKVRDQIFIDIFGEDINEYLEKLEKVSKGYYELDEYDKQVLSIALEQNTCGLRFQAFKDYL